MAAIQSKYWAGSSLPEKLLLMKRTLNAVMAYEETSTPERAKEAWSHLVCTLKGRYGPELPLWKFDVLRTPELRDVAATDAARADMILIATRGGGELPAEVKTWIEVWIAQKREAQDEQSTLAVLFDAPPDKVGAFALAQFAYLQRVARRGSMDFLVSTFDQPGETTGFSRLRIAEGPRAATSPMVMPKESQRL
jgi:hypothetical protein